MDDLISRRMAIDTLMPIVKSASLRNRNVYSTAKRCLFEVEALPTIDAVPVVRCKDCKFSDWYTDPYGEHRCYCMEHGSAGHSEKDFCSYAERETDE